jgi:hypothetical protein
MSHWAASLFATGMDAITKNQSNGQGALAGVMSSVIRYPIKALAAFVVAPFLAFRVARFAKNPIRRGIAAVGLFLAVLLAWAAGTFLGTIAGALLVFSNFGPIVALGFVLGTTLSVTLSVTFSILVLNATSWFFLQLSSDDVIAHLKSISE